ncbi:MAG: hypothetical protein II943_11740 [Victivallales bacterium]|nr:hypothetical protein [Victivallales bacterium]
MKTLVHCFWLLQVIFCAMAFAESVEVKTISMTVGKSVVEDTNMAIKSYRIEPLTDIIKVSLTGETFLHITANKQGEATIIVNSVGGETKMYAVTVQSTLTTELRKLRNDLEDLPELDINIDEDRIVIKGTVSNSEHWAHFQRVLANNRGGKIVNYAVFRPSTATLTKLQKQLEERGFTFCAPDAVPGPGELLMKLSGDTLMVKGEFYSQEEIDRVRSILAMQQAWLGARDGKIRLDDQLELKVVHISVEVVFVAINSSEAKKLGSDSSIFAALDLGYLWDAVAGNRARNNMTVGGGATATARFLENNGVSRNYTADTLTITSDNKSTSTRVGRTDHIRVSGSENGDIKDIYYGLELTVSGKLVADGKVDLSLNIKNSSKLGELSESNSDYNGPVRLELNKTTILTGFQQIAETASKSGMPILRDIPVLQWFVSSDSKSKDDSRLLVLIYPRVREIDETSGPQIEISLPEEIGDTYQEVRNPSEEESTKPWYKRWFGF